MGDSHTRDDSAPGRREQLAGPTEGRLVYVCETFPKLTQTFTAREVALLREQDLDIGVVSFHRAPHAPLDDLARGLLPLTTFMPAPHSAAFLGPVLQTLVRHPVAVLRLTLEGLLSRGLLQTTWRMRAQGVLAATRGAWIASTNPDASWFHAEFADTAAAAAMAAAELAGRPFSFKSHASFNPQQLVRKAQRAAFVVTESEFTRRHYFAHLPDERVLVNRGGLPGEPGQPREASDDTLRILSVGTLQEKKGHRHLLGALGRLRQDGVAFRCLVVGSGPLEGELRDAVATADLQTQVSIEPYRSYDEVAAVYRDFDVFVLPCVVASDGDRDGIPTVLIEAGAAGCALVSTPVSGIPELVRDGVSGLLVPESDEAALAGALHRLALDPELRDELARGADRVIRERFDLRRNVAALAQRFRDELG